MQIVLPVACLTVNSFSVKNSVNICHKLCVLFFLHSSQRHRGVYRQTEILLGSKCRLPLNRIGFLNGRVRLAVPFINEKFSTIYLMVCVLGKWKADTLAHRKEITDQSERANVLLDIVDNIRDA